MTLRTSNNPNTDAIVLTALVPIVLGLYGADGVSQSANTQLAVASAAQGGDPTGADRVYVQQEYTMVNNNRFPAVLLSAGQQAYVRQSQRSFDGQMVANVDYYATWPESNNTYDTIRANVAADLERIKSNIESNDSLTQGGQNYTISTVKYTLAPYEGTLKQYGASVFVMRRLAIVFNLLPYDV
jgi:hypothetical protein